MIDLHTHSTASDGEFSPSVLAEKAKSAGVTVWALTDHDTIDGIEEAKTAAEKLGLIFVPGTELNIKWSSGEFHLLGLNLQRPSEKLNEILTKLKNGRTERNRLIIERMKNDGFNVTVEELQQKYNTEIIGRPHIAKYLVETNVVRKSQDAFNKYLGKGRPWYVERYGADLKESVEAIVDAGGTPVIAHPLSLYVSWGKLEGVLQSVKDAGVLGLEAFHPGAKYGEALRLKELASKLGFFITGGSDFHGPSIRKDRHLGKASGDRKIDEKILAQIPFLNL